MNQPEVLLARISSLERQVRIMRRASLLFVLATILGVTGAWISGSQDEVIRARQIVIEDEEGRARMLIGRQSDFGGQRTPSMGMSINDTLGFEHFGMGLRDSGRMSMGFDAPLGTGDDRNRERINIIVDENGGAQIRLLDRRTRVKGRLALGPDDEWRLEFLDFGQSELRRRLIGFAGDSLAVESR